ncbi:hypothetical protein MPL3365_10012 [Mesorhizobium plurifarium]|uniref:Uncharacterized protein n=1 Tax=Mesorhizobium plurifarium TaxID=69974 RepID=A0A090FSU2_MESPL|nr:hypothetical protein MPL3365_10012 [Mesorhizobium plurifarium]
MPAPFFRPREKSILNGGSRYARETISSPTRRIDDQPSDFKALPGNALGLACREAVRRLRIKKLRQSPPSTSNEILM